MQNFLYLSVLLFSLGGLLFLDAQKKLAWFWSWKKTAVLLGVNLLFFLVWDMANIARGIISTNQAWVTGWYIGISDLPIEEFLFLTLLGYQTILLWRWRCTRMLS